MPAPAAAAGPWLLLPRCWLLAAGRCRLLAGRLPEMARRVLCCPSGGRPSGCSRGPLLHTLDGIRRLPPGGHRLRHGQRSQGPAIRREAASQRGRAGRRWVGRGAARQPTPALACLARPTASPLARPPAWPRLLPPLPRHRLAAANWPLLPTGAPADCAGPRAPASGGVQQRPGPPSAPPFLFPASATTGGAEAVFSVSRAPWGHRTALASHGPAAGIYPPRYERTRNFEIHSHSSSPRHAPAVPLPPL
jgi:hypothetical protein